MSTAGMRLCLIYFFNILNLSCFSIKRNEICVSKILITKNLLFLPCSMSGRIIIANSGYEFTRDKWLKSGLTLFNLTTVGAMQGLNTLIAFFCIFYQVWNRKNLLELLRKFIKFHQRFKLTDNKQFYKQEAKLYEKLAFLSLIAFLLFLLELAVNFQPKWKYFVLAISNPSQGIFLLFVIGFVHCFLFYLEFIFINLTHETKKLNKVSLKASADQFAIVFSYFVDCRDLLASSQKTFGFFLSVFMIHIFTTVTVRVS